MNLVTNRQHFVSQRVLERPTENLNRHAVLVHLARLGEFHAASHWANHSQVTVTVLVIGAREQLGEVRRPTSEAGIVFFGLLNLERVVRAAPVVNSEGGVATHEEIFV